MPDCQSGKGQATSGQIVKVESRCQTIPFVGRGQATWGQIVDVLKSWGKIGAACLKLDRTKQVFKVLLEDYRLMVWLPVHLDFIGHVQSIVAQMSEQMLFKVGVTIDPELRYWGTSSIFDFAGGSSHYAYSQEYAKNKDKVEYEGLIVVTVNCNREAIEALEHGAIKFLKQLFPRRCVNRKEDQDSKQDRDEGSGDEAVGPHFLYVAYGLPRHRQSEIGLPHSASSLEHEVSRHFALAFGNMKPGVSLFKPLSKAWAACVVG